MLRVERGTGSMVVSLAATRRPLRAARRVDLPPAQSDGSLGVSDLISSFIIYTHEGYFNGQGVSGMGFILSLGIEGAVLLY